MIDIHSHILPGIDDGSKNIKMTLDMLRMAEKDGTTDIIATPHFCRGYGEATYFQVKEYVKHFNLLAKEENIDINIYYGQEVYYSESLLSDFKDGIIGTINDSRYMLLELDMANFEPEVLDTIYELKVMGIQPILAHPERYKFIIEKPSRINRFINEGVLFQMNSGSIVGNFGQSVRKTAEILLDHRIYSFIGSDAHNNNTRCPGVAEGIKTSIIRNKVYKEAFISNGEALVNDKNVRFKGEHIKEKKSIFSFLK